MPSLFDRAVQEIGQYYGVPDKDNKQSFLKRMTDKDGQKDRAFKDYVSPGPIDELISDMQDRSKPGLGVVAILKTLQSMTQATTDKTAADAKPVVAGTLGKEIRICFEPGVVGAEDIEKAVMVRKPDPSGKMQGSSRMKDGTVSIRTQLKQEGETDKLNKGGESPTKASPNLSFIQINDCRKTPVSRGTGAVSIFMNAIPTLEWSRCSPRLDITIVHDNPPLSNDNKLVAMGVTQDLLGNVKLDIPKAKSEVSPQFLLATAADVQALEGLNALLIGDKETVHTTPGSKTGDKVVPPTIASYTTTGMEMFLSPQTMTSGAPYIDYAAASSIAPGTGDPVVEAQTASDKNPPGGGSRPVGVIDRFRPLAGIKEFKVSVQCGPAFLSWKTAELEIICYDRSRLYILAPLIKPDRYGRTRLMIDYGWTHAAGSWSPADPGAALSSTLAGTSALRNAYAIFLNGMNRKEIFTVSNCSYQFEKEGTISISIKLATCGGDRMNSLQIQQGVKGLIEQRNAIEKIIKSVNDMRSKILGSDNASAKAIVQESFMNSTSTSSRALTMNEDTREKLDDFLGTPSKDRDIAALQDLIDKLLGGATSTYKNTIASAISTKKTLIKKDDAWIRPIKNSKLEVKTGESNPTYISLAKIFLHFVAQPVVASKDFEEVQVLFYAINAKASCMHNFNLAQYPIRRDRFFSQFEKLAEGGLNMSLAKFVGFLRSTFVSQNADFPYGFNEMYTFDSDDGGYELSDKMKEEKKGKQKALIDNEMKETLAIAYKSEGKDVPSEELIFRCPKLSYHVEAVPLAHSNSATEPKTLLRIHIYDAQNSGNTCERQLLRAAVDNTLGMLGNFAGAMPDKPDTWNNKHVEAFQDGLQHAFKAGIIEPTDPSVIVNGKLTEIALGNFMLKTNFESIKRYISYNIPTITYGSNFTAITSAGLTTMQNDGIAAIMLARSAGNNPAGAPGAPGGGPPMQLLPTKLSMESFGCPLIEIGQEFFVDFGTGTSMDNIFQVISATHTISATGFTTDMELINQEAYGQWTSTADILGKAKTKLAHLKKVSQAKAPPAEV